MESIAARDGHKLGLEIYVDISDRILDFALSRPNLFFFLLNEDPEFYRSVEEGRGGFICELFVSRLLDPAKAADFRRAAFFFDLLMHRLIVASARGTHRMCAEECRALSREAYRLLLKPYEEAFWQDPPLAEDLLKIDLTAHINPKRGFPR